HIACRGTKNVVYCRRFHREWRNYMERARQEAYIRSFATRPEVRRMEQFVQHGNTSCLLHCVAVAHVSFAIARALHLRVREEALSRGALLHDYFLYDWHVRDPLRKKHAFFHP